MSHINGILRRAGVAKPGNTSSCQGGPGTVWKGNCQSKPQWTINIFEPFKSVGLMKLCLQYCSKELSTKRLICAVYIEPVWQEDIYPKLGDRLG